MRNQTIAFFNMLLVLSTLVSSVISTSLFAQTEALVFKQAEVEVGGKTLEVEFADNWDLRAQGLMGRESMCDDCGMLFDFEYARRVSMWMKNTLIPLDVAFITRAGVITDIKQMKPLDLTSVPSSKKVQYALEMNQGWFGKHGVKEGDKIKITK
ncbi:DUF192 domain-containing protein [Alteromonas sp. a30]|uniref:DUF192 domain-containing protein n=1 Tax=Alteromonas sp. a30 TaxID=2730917 RepID=UPI0022815071|nr:DUF192 domain-containing protein [Alteromonas sp. a30]MCY7296148.1 DUF192 domain-containing protein [Alteromonas sp. a30]